MDSIWEKVKLHQGETFHTELEMAVGYPIQMMDFCSQPTTIIGAFMK